MKMRKLYDIRSKLIHGSIPHLNHDVRHDLQRAKDYLKRVVLKELELL